MKKESRSKETAVSDDVDKKWTRWVMQTARTWQDVEKIIRKTGVEKIDQDHRQITEQMLQFNRLVEQISENRFDLKFVQKQGALLEKLHATIEQHFKREEEIIRAYKLPALKEQAHQHQRFLNSVEAVRRDHKAGRLTVSHQLKLSFLEWWIEHINRLDYKSFCMENWALGVIRHARVWHDVETLIKKTGIDRLDQDHREMTELMLKFNPILDQWQKEQKIDKKSCLDLVSSLHRYALEHFSREEQMIQTYKLLNLSEQRRQHAGFMKMVEGFRTSIEREAISELTQVRQRMLTWWVNHINQIDYDTFAQKNWVLDLMGRAEKWQDVAELIRSTSVEILDDDHRELTEKIVKLNRVMALQGGERNEQLKKLFSQMKAIARPHFEREEAWMREQSFVGYSAHKEQHERFFEMLDRYQKDLEAERVRLSDKIKISLLDWWVHHINEVDYYTFNPKGAENMENAYLLLSAPTLSDE
ncbi:bacteriohemerythrin [Magnetococcales bacterium HHB-1]